MTRDQFIQQAYLMAVGKATPPASGTNKHSVLLQAGNIFIQQWQDEPNTDWKSLYQRTELADEVTATDTFALDATVIRKLSVNKDDKVIVTSPDGIEAKYTIVTPNQLRSYDNACARIGNNLVFNKPFDNDSEFIGGTITVPNYGYASLLVQANDLVPVDQPLWLVYMVAAEFVRNNDYIKQNQYSNLIALAAEVMKSMKKNNGESQIVEPLRDWTPLGQSW